MRLSGEAIAAEFGARGEELVSRIDSTGARASEVLSSQGDGVIARLAETSDAVADEFWGRAATRSSVASTRRAAAPQRQSSRMATTSLAALLRRANRWRASSARAVRRSSAALTRAAFARPKPSSRMATMFSTGSPRRATDWPANLDRARENLIDRLEAVGARIWRDWRAWRSRRHAPRRRPPKRLPMNLERAATVSPIASTQAARAFTRPSSVAGTRWFPALPRPAIVCTKRSWCRDSALDEGLAASHQRLVSQLTERTSEARDLFEAAAAEWSEPVRNARTIWSATNSKATPTSSAQDSKRLLSAQSRPSPTITRRRMND